MNGLMMDYPLTLHHFLERAGRLFPNKEIVSRTTCRRAPVSLCAITTGAHIAWLMRFDK